MIQTSTLQPSVTRRPELVIEAGETDTVTTNLAAEESVAGACTTLDVLPQTLTDETPADLDNPGTANAGTGFAAAAVLGLGGVAIILVCHFCSRDCDFIAALIGVAFCLAGWGLATRSFPHTTQEYSSYPQSETDSR
jgi:hypothetical protein